MNREQRYFDRARPLLVCPSRRWGTIERKAVQDYLYLQSLKAMPYMMCVKGSYIDLELKGENVHKVYIGRVAKNFFSDIKYGLTIFRTVRKYKINLVHCYDFSSVWGVSIALQAMLAIPQVMTLNFWGEPWIKSPYLYKALLSRVDSIIVFSPAIREAVLETMPMMKRKINVFGMGVQLHKQKKQNKDLQQFVVTTHIADHVHSSKQIRHVLDVLGRSFHGGGVGQGIVFQVITRKKMDDFSFFDELRDEISHYQYQGLLQWKQTDQVIEALGKGDLYWSLESSEMLSDREVQALLLGKPLLLSRTSARQDFVRKGPFLGESYRRGDAREVMEKIQKVMESYSLYIDSIYEQWDEIFEKHSRQRYQEYLEQLYPLLHSKRQRVLKWSREKKATG